MSLTSEEKEYIKGNESMITGIVNALTIVTQFKDGDFLVAFHPSTSWDSNKKRPVTNSYGAVKKFKVVATDSHGIPYMKELSKRGKPIGSLISSIRFEETHSGHYGKLHASLTYIFEVDPDYADAIILDDQANYNAANILKEKSDTFKEISKHNKAIKVNTNSKVLPAFLATVKVGDLLWRSNMSSWTVTEIGAVPRNNANRIGYNTVFMKVTTNKGKELPLTFNDVSDRALYTARPRSYKELKDPK